MCLLTSNSCGYDPNEATGFVVGDVGIVHLATGTHGSPFCKMFLLLVQ